MNDSPPLSTAELADPILCASLPAAGALDRALLEVLGPLRDDLAALDPASRAYLWVMRYGKGGEHLKIRIHGPASLGDALRRALGERATSWLATFDSPEIDGSAGAQAPSIDPEDDQPWSGGLRWTTWRRNHINLAGPPFLDDDSYVALATECLGRGCEQLLGSLRLGADGRVPGGLRQQTLLRLLISGIAALDLAPELRSAYLAYHRDWLIRFFLPAGSGSEQQAMVRGRFDLRLEAMAPALAQIRSAITSLWPAAAKIPPTPWQELDDPWARSLAALHHHVTALCQDPRFHHDPTAPDPTFSPVFKAFHGLGNQLGLPPIDEAFTHHLLWRASGGEAA